MYHTGSSVLGWCCAKKAPFSRCWFSESIQQHVYKCIVSRRSRRPPCQAFGRYNICSRKIFTRKPSTLHHLTSIYYMYHSKNLPNSKWSSPKNKEPPEHNPPPNKKQLILTSTVFHSLTRWLVPQTSTSLPPGVSKWCSGDFTLLRATERCLPRCLFFWSIECWGGIQRKTCLQVCLLNDTRINIFRLVKIGSEKNSQWFCLSVWNGGKGRHNPFLFGRRPISFWTFWLRSGNTCRFKKLVSFLPVNSSGTSFVCYRHTNMV